jgi:hypothetical protein
MRPACYCFVTVTSEGEQTTMSSRRKSPQLTILASPELIERTKELAAQADKTHAEWIRDAMREKAQREERFGEPQAPGRRG